MSLLQQVQQDCQELGILYEDPDFPADESSVGVTIRDQFDKAVPIHWQRPHEICRDATFISDGLSRFDLVQGTLADCWLVAAMACISERSTLLKRVVPEDQTLDPSEGYCGACHFYFFRFGRWEEVVIDDRLPTDGFGHLLFIKSTQKNEFWSALLEKAFAKVNKKYCNLQSGDVTDALQEMTGGVIERLKLSDKNDETNLNNIKNILFKGFERNSFFGCAIHKIPEGTTETMKSDVPQPILNNGLLRRHAYSIMDIRIILRKSSKTGRSEQITLLKVRNPWGKTEWNGKWSDESSEWKHVSEQVKKELGLVVNDDGEFWMEWNDFVANFEVIQACHLHPDDVKQKKFKLWNVHSFKDEWIQGVSAGGNPGSGTFHKSPHYLLRLDDSDDPDLTAECLVSIEEPSLRHLGDNHKDQYVGKAIYVYRVEDPQYADLPINYSDRIQFDQDFFDYTECVTYTPYLMDKTNVQRFALEPGVYLFLGSCYTTDIDRPFLIRFFAERI